MGTVLSNVFQRKFGGSEKKRKHNLLLSLRKRHNCSQKPRPDFGVVAKYGNLQTLVLSATKKTMTSSCCCCASKGDDDNVRQYDDLKSHGSVAPTMQSMKRDTKTGSSPGDDSSDVQAVDWWRTRSQETNQSSNAGQRNMATPDRTSSSTTQPMQLSPEEELSWAKATSENNNSNSNSNAIYSMYGQHPATANRMATVESIEVDELSAVQEELKRREIQDFMPITMPTQRAPSLPIERTRTEDSAVTSESSLQFKYTEHEEEEDMQVVGHRNRGEHSPSYPRRGSGHRRPAPHHVPDRASPNSLHDLRHGTVPMVDAEVAKDYLEAADNSVDLDRDELDEIVLGVKAVPRTAALTTRRDEVETNRVEHLLTGRGNNNVRKSSPVNNQSTVGAKSSQSPIPGRAPVSPNRPPTPTEAAAAAAAAASQIRGSGTVNPRFQMEANRASNFESLSSVPSNVDSDTRDRYLLACRLLKATMIEKDSKLLPEDRDFLRDLLSMTEQAQAHCEHDIAAIETASDLLSDAGTEDDILIPQQQDRFRVASLKEAWQRKAQELFASRPANTPGLVLPTPKTTSYPPPTESRELRTPDSPERNKDPPTSPFVILGKKPNSSPGVLTPPLMEALRGFFPYAKAEENFWLKYKLDEHGDTLHSLLSHIKNCKYTIIGVETKDGHVFGAFCSSHWKVHPSWFGSGECFLWRLKRSRLAGGGQTPNYDFDNEMEVYPYTGHDDQIQYCTERTLAVGGGEWSLVNGSFDTSPHQDEPVGIAFMLDGDLMGGETNSCATFANPRLCGKESGNNEFDVVALEVWTLTPCLTISEAQKLEDKRAFVEKHTIHH